MMAEPKVKLNCSTPGCSATMSPSDPIWRDGREGLPIYLCSASAYRRETGKDPVAARPEPRRSKRAPQRERLWGEMT